MKFPLLTLFVIFIIVLTIRLKSSSSREENRIKAFWERESLANSTRKKNIDNLPYIPFDMSLIPVHSELDDDRVKEYLSDLSSLTGKRILNCTGKSNTDLKLEYGAPNITRLTEYDSNYTILVRSVARLAEKYLVHASLSLQDISTGGSDGSMVSDARGRSEKLKEDAVKLLEYGISIGTDVRLNYELLAGIYAEKGDAASIEALRETAMSLNSLSKEPILRMLDRTEASMQPGFEA